MASPFLVLVEGYRPFFLSPFGSFADSLDSGKKSYPHSSFDKRKVLNDKEYNLGVFHKSREKEMSDRTYPQRPWLGVGGVVFRGEEVLLVKRGRDPGKGRWSIPGGAVALGETVKTALIREIREETGLDVKVLDLVEVFERIIPDDQGRILYHFVVLDYRCTLLGGRLKAQSDAAEAGFFPLAVLKDLNLPEYTEQVIRKAYAAVDGE